MIYDGRRRVTPEFHYKLKIPPRGKKWAGIVRVISTSVGRFRGDTPPRHVAGARDIELSAMNLILHRHDARPQPQDLGVGSFELRRITRSSLGGVYRQYPIFPPLGLNQLPPRLIQQYRE